MTTEQKMFSEWFALSSKKLSSRGARCANEEMRAGWGGAIPPQCPAPTWTPGKGGDAGLRDAFITTLCINDIHFRMREHNYRTEPPTVGIKFNTALDNHPDGSGLLIDHTVNLLITIRNIRRITMSPEKDARMNEVKVLLRLVMKMRLNLVYLKASHMVPCWADNFIIAMIMYLEDGPINDPSSASPA